MTDFFELIVSVGEAGSIYALMALAYLVVLRPTGIINFAVGEWAMLGGFAAVTAITWNKLHWLPGMLAAMAAIGAIAWLTERLVVRSLTDRGAPVLSAILALLGMLIIYRESASWIYGFDPLFVPMPFGFGRVEVGPFAGTSQSFLIIGIVLGVFVGVWFFFERTVWGRAFEAVALNRQAAALMGINLGHVMGLSFAGAGAVAGLAGVLQSPLTSASYLAGLPLAVKGFTALVIGGVGRVEGALLGGLLLALLEKLVVRYAPIPSGLALGVPLILLIVFLLVRPSGLLAPRTGR
jgi:branched-chain amino acid transport system permease protein